MAKYDRVAMNPIALTEMVDRVLGDRYRLEALIGVGAISAVFAATDLEAERRVAVKVFDEALAEDERFTERLFDAIEQAAVLNHTNIVEVFDWGIDGGPYIVSELCEGGSLAALLEAGHTLEPSQALVMALECARALNHGHEQGAIHRNITPSNVLFTDDQRVRIADYGLAKVVAEAPVSQASRALENVRYASPEQARGRPVGESSDLYSLALVVSEAVSGEQPHVAETVVGTLMDRAEAAADLHPALGDLLPSLERCGRVEPDQRPEAEELAIALLAAAETMPRPNPLPLVGIDPEQSLGDTDLRVIGGVPAEQDASSTVDGNREAVQTEVDTAHGADGEEHDDFDVSALGELDDLDVFSGDSLDDEIADEAIDEAQSELSLVEDEPQTGGLDNLEQAAPVFAEVPGATAAELDVPESTPRHSATLAYEQDEDDADDRLPWWPLLLLGVLIAGAVAAGVYFFAFADSNAAAVVPDLVGTQFADVDERLDGREWQVERLETRVDGSTVGSVVAQDPSAGAALDDDGTLVLTVSLGNAMVEIPSDIVGLSVDQAESRLGTVGLLLGSLAEEKNEALAAGLIIGLDEPTTQKPSGERVNLRVSSGPVDRIVPSEVIGMDIADATSLLVGLRLQPVEEPAYSPDAEVGVVLASIPNAGEAVPADSAVTLIVSAGPEPVEMPDIIGLELEEAIDVIEALGLIWIDTTGTPGEEVIGSLPPIGATVEVGTEVTIILADPPEDEEADEEN